MAYNPLLDVEAPRPSDPSSDMAKRTPQSNVPWAYGTAPPNSATRERPGQVNRLVPQWMQNNATRDMATLVDPNNPYGTVAPSSQSSTPSGVPAVTPTYFQGPAGPTTSGNLINPLAMNMFMTNAVGPMIDKSAQQLQDWNVQMGQMAQNNVMNKYMPPQFQAYFNNVNQQQMQQNADLTSSMAAASKSAPALDQLMSQVNNALQAQKQTYAQELYNSAQGGGLGGTSIYGPPGSPTTPGKNAGDEQTVGTTTYQWNGTQWAPK